MPHDAAAAAFTRSGRRLFAQASPSLQAAVGPDWQPWLSAAYCDCGTALASTSVQPEWKGDAERWRKKGWSEARIARALSEQLARHEQDQQVCRDRALADAGQWLQRIDALLVCGAYRTSGACLRRLGARQPKPPEHHWSRISSPGILAFAPGTLHWIERG